MATHNIAYVSRIDSLDALRGFALFGLFIVHMPELFELYWAHPTTDPAQLWWHNLVFTVFGGKAFAMLALCFGVSFFIMMERAARRGVDFTGRFVWRLAVLGLIGLLHGVWYRGDILEVLALMGLLVVPFYRIASDRLVGALAVFFLLQPLMIVQIAAGLGGAAWANQPLGFWSAAMPEVYTHGGTLLETMKANVLDGHGFKWLFMYESGRLSQIVGLSLLGLVLGRKGFFSEPARYRDACRLGFLLSLVTLVLLHLFKEPLTSLMPASETMSMPRALWESMLSGWFDLAMMSCLVLGFIILYHAASGRVLGVLAPTGRMTLTLYLLQSLIFVPFFYSFGMNMHATITQTQAIALGVGAFAVQLLFAHLWFKAFLYGPVEWLWRAATYLTWNVPFVRNRADGAVAPGTNA